MWKTKYWQKPYFMRFCLTLSDYFDINKNASKDGK